MIKKKNSYNVAVVGATGNVGKVFLEILHERNFPINEVYAVSSANSAGKKMSFGDKVISSYSIQGFDFRKRFIDIVFGATSGDVAKNYVPRAMEEGAFVIDNSSHFRLNNEVPLIVPEVNFSDLSKYSNSQIIANPNCCAIPIALVLKPLDNVARIKRIVISTYQSTSGAGKAAMDELYHHTKNKFVFGQNEPNVFSKEIAFNIIPQINNFNDNLYTGEENKIIDEVRKIMGDHVAITVTSVRVPVFVGHSFSVNVEFEKFISATEAEEILSEQDGLDVINVDSEMSFATPLDVVGEDNVFVSRIRQDNSLKNGLNMWIVSDNLRKGAALNAVQIAEELIKSL